MFPGMVYAILTRNPDFVDDMSVLLRLAGGEVLLVVGRICEASGGGGGRRDVRGGPGVQGGLISSR